MDPASQPRYLTKSRFKLAVECPTKLFYTGKTDVYPDATKNNEFLRALADGGFQIGELAKLMFPGGHEVTGPTHQTQVDETRDFLARDTVTLFEAAICHGGFFARADVLRKAGMQIELIEVKAKSFDSSDQYAFRGKNGRLDRNMLPYLQDVAFQRHVLSLAYPHFQIRSFLMLIDTAKTCSVDGLNQRFKIHREGGKSYVLTAPGTDAATIGSPVLQCANVDDFVDEILREPLSAPGATGLLPDLAKTWAEHYRSDTRIPPAIGAQCAACEFRAHPTNAGLRSGFRECWAAAAGWSEQDFAEDNVLDLWKFRGKQALIERRVLKLRDVTKADLKYHEAADGLSTSQRQWMQVSGRWPGRPDFYLDEALMKQKMASWTFPLHFIDFETARVAIPYLAGQHPYANIAFQFSHHVVDADRNVAHRSQFVSTTPGTKPNYEFVRQLRSALGSVGTVFMWSPHERTTLSAVLAELQQDAAPPADAGDLMEFIASLTSMKDAGGVTRPGSREMVDLCWLAEHAFFHPDTKGSCSIKKVLPAVLKSSDFLRRRYSEPIYGATGGIPSLNFKDFRWWRESGGAVLEPYKLLPPVSGGLAGDDSKVDSAPDDAEQLAEGGAATMAYAQLQFEDIAPDERRQLESALLRYCELDTLAMVMVYEAWREWLG